MLYTTNKFANLADFGGHRHGERGPQRTSADLTLKRPFEYARILERPFVYARILERPFEYARILSNDFFQEIELKHGSVFKRFLIDFQIRHGPRVFEFDFFKEIELKHGSETPRYRVQTFFD